MNSRYRAATAATFLSIFISLIGTARAGQQVNTGQSPIDPSTGTVVVPSNSQEAADRNLTVGYAVDHSTGLDHAVLWKGNASSAVDLNPFGFASSIAIGTDGTQQVGQGIATSTTNEHALLWRGKWSSAVDLNPRGFVASVASGTDRAEEVGTGTRSDNTYHALLWTGSAASAIDLNPTGFTDSVADGTNGIRQVGEGFGPSTSNYQHALVWTDTAKSAVDLNPTALPGIHSSFALGMAGSDEVGYAVAANKTHVALLWKGTAASAVDLNPKGFTFSVAYGTNGIEQVGEGYGPATNGQLHALLWNGTANSVIDLTAALPAGFTKSFAFSIDAERNIYGYAENASGSLKPMEWEAPTVGSAAPEPGDAGALAIGAIALSARRRKRRPTPCVTLTSVARVARPCLLLP